MGLCTSCDAATPVATAKVILSDGRLKEYPYPVKVWYVLQKDSDTFLCNSDDMEFDDVVSAVDGDEELQPGQLYFALPLSLLHRRLQPEEMAALAVKASAALMKGHKCGCRSKVLFTEKEMPPEGDKTVSGRRRERKSNGGGRSRRRSQDFTAALSAIPE